MNEVPLIRLTGIERVLGDQTWRVTLSGGVERQALSREGADAILEAPALALGLARGRGRAALTVVHDGHTVRIERDLDAGTLTATRDGVALSPAGRVFDEVAGGHPEALAAELVLDLVALEMARQERRGRRLALRAEMGEIVVPNTIGTLMVGTAVALAIAGVGAILPTMRAAIFGFAALVLCAVVAYALFTSSQATRHQRAVGGALDELEDEASAIEARFAEWAEAQRGAPGLPLIVRLRTGDAAPARDSPRQVVVIEELA